MKEIADSLQGYLRDQHSVGYDGSLYRTLKRKLCANHIFPKPETLITDPNAYLNFQKHLQELSTHPKGMNLALSLMVEVNVALGILLHSDTEKSKELQNHITQGNFILGTAVSEPGWEGSLKKLTSSITADLKLSGTKSFITNGGCADAVLWVVPSGDSFSVYHVDLHQNQNFFQNELIQTPFLKLVSHSRLTVDHVPLKSSDLILTDYKKLGIELRLKELFSLISLLLGYVCTIPKLSSFDELFHQWNILREWRDKTSKGLLPENYLTILEDSFPFPIEGLLLALTKHLELESPKDLVKRNADLAIFLWEDQFTRYLLAKKAKTKRNQ